MKIRIGVEGGRRAVLRTAHALNAPILVSANSLWNHQRRRFSGWQIYREHDTALDSGGFVAMKRYGGYRWTIPQYVALAGAMRPSWWAQMDFCCEPELAADRAAVRQRIELTAHHLRECQLVADDSATAPPMPVLQGWRPEDYCHGPIYERGYRWPRLVGIGSVCRRPVNGPCGILAVIAALDRVVPLGVRFHFFGVKSQAIAALCEHFPHRCESMDSMAWNTEYRWDVHHNGRPQTSAVRAEHAGRWYRRQLQLLH